MAVAEEKGVGTEGQRWGARVSQILKTRDRRLEGFLYSVTKVHSTMPPFFKDKRTWGGCCGGYVNTGGCVVGGRPGICGPGNGGRAYVIPCGAFRI